MNKRYAERGENVTNIRRFMWTYVLVLFLLIAAGLLLYWMPDKIPPDLPSRIICKNNAISLLNAGYNMLFNQKCCQTVKRLSLKLATTQQALRRAVRLRSTALYSQCDSSQIPEGESKAAYIHGATAVRGTDTVEWGGKIALWGLIPLWRAAPPPDTVLSLRRPTPSDCWPFSGSEGEIIINVPPQALVDGISVEHVRPDTAHSAPKRFTVHGVISNGTWLRLLDAVYQYNQPAKQYFALQHKDVLWKHIVFKVLSNHGNTKYTCIYRLHLYKN